MLAPRAKVPRALLQLPLLVAIGVVLYRLRPFFDMGTLPQRGGPGLPFQGSDLTPAFAAWARVAIEAARHGSLALWNRFMHTGAPLLAMPQAGVVSLQTLLGLVLAPEDAVRFAMLAHVVIGMVGVAALGRVIGVPRTFAGAGALAFGLNTYLLDHFRVGHLSQVNPMTLMPLTLACVFSAASGGPLLHAALGGTLVGLQLLEGGDSALFYEALTLAILPFAMLAGRGAVPYFLRTVRTGLIVGVGAFFVAAFQLLPMLEYVGHTGRAGGLRLEDAVSAIHEVATPLPGPWLKWLAYAGLVFLLLTLRQRAALWLFAACYLGFEVADRTEVFTFLWQHVPGFRYQRIPERALVIPGVLLPVLVGAGLALPWAIGSRFGRVAEALGVGVALFLAVGLGRELWERAPQNPPMGSVEKELSSNNTMQWLAKNAGGARVHVWETPNRHWGTDHVTVPLGLETVTGYTSTEHRDYLEGDFDPPGHRNFFGETYRSPAKLWGMLSVRHVSSLTPRGEEGFRLAARVAPCPREICQPEKSAGTFIYEDLRYLPRARRVQQALLLVGEPRKAFERALDLMELPEFDPAKSVILQVAPGAPQPKAAVVLDAAAPFESQRAQAAALFAQAPSLPQAGTFERPDTNRIRATAEGDGWLVLSERVALFAGWKATVDGKELPIVRANGVLAALEVPKGATVELVYRPPGFRTGLWLLAAWGLILVVAVEREWRRRRYP